MPDLLAQNLVDLEKIVENGGLKISKSPSCILNYLLSH